MLSSDVSGSNSVPQHVCLADASGTSERQQAHHGIRIPLIPLRISNILLASFSWKLWDADLGNKPSQPSGLAWSGKDV